MAWVERFLRYRKGRHTGLPASELASLTRHSFRLDDETPTVTVQAAYFKHRRQDVLPLHPSLVTVLRPWLAAKPEWGRVWPGKWAESKFAGKIMQVDLEAAGVEYIDAHGL